MTVTDTPPPTTDDEAAAALAAAEAAEDTEPTNLPAVRTTAPGWATKVNPVTGMSIVPAQDEIRTLASLANTLSTSHLVPAALRDKPEDVLLVFLTARDNGVALTTALREFHPINGVVSMSPKVRHAMANMRAQEMGWKVYPDPGNDDWQATWHCERDGSTYSVTFTWEHAKQAGLVGMACEPNAHSEVCVKGQPSSGKAKGECKSNWYEWQARMLSARARGFLLDDAIPEVATGLYSPDELGAITDAEGEPIDLDAVEVPQGMKPSKRQRQRAGTEKVDRQLTAEERANIRARIAHLPAEGQEAVKDAWTRPRTNERGEVVSRFLPGLDHCCESHLRKIDALLASTEQRAARGTWGDWTPMPPAAASSDNSGTPAPEEAGEGEGREVPAPPADPASPVSGSATDEDTQAAADAADAKARADMEAALSDAAPPATVAPVDTTADDELEAIAQAYEGLTPHQQEWLAAAIAKEGIRHDQLATSPTARATFKALVDGAAMQPAEAPQEATEPADGPDTHDDPAEAHTDDLVAKAAEVAAKAQAKHGKAAPPEQGDLLGS